MELSQIAGLAGIPYVRLAIQSLNLSGWYALIASTILAVILNVAVAILAGGSIVSGLVLGVVVGVMSNFYNDLKSVEIK